MSILYNSSQCHRQINDHVSPQFLVEYDSSNAHMDNNISLALLSHSRKQTARTPQLPFRTLH
ncbi:hypothetical protein Fmac_005845 [Flemingia macrophylla]|uniref:Uncharacterized protein n=1 Tax=Flemingia macrophylla TaxID=520843 RepID=A0ABD1LVJ5_9FABA